MLLNKVNEQTSNSRLSLLRQVSASEILSHWNRFDPVILFSDTKKALQRHLYLFTGYYASITATSFDMNRLHLLCSHVPSRVIIMMCVFILKISSLQQKSQTWNQAVGQVMCFTPKHYKTRLMQLCRAIITVNLFSFRLALVLLHDSPEIGLHH